MSKNVTVIPPKTGGFGELVKTGGKAALMRLNPTQVIAEYLDYKRKVAEEETKREEIWAKRDVALATLSAQKELIEKYFKERFAERAAGLDKFFDLLDSAIEGKNEKQMELALAGILGILKDSPLKDFETFRESFQKENFLIEI